MPKMARYKHPVVSSPGWSAASNHGDLLRSSRPQIRIAIGMLILERLFEYDSVFRGSTYQKWHW